MPCALTSNAGYPDYLKKILKEIDIGNDEDLKNCACKLVTPVTDEGCEILDEDNKVGAFPFCSTLVTDGVGEDTEYPLKLTLKQAMNLYWQTTKWKFDASADGYSCGLTYHIDFTESKKTSVKFVNFDDEVDPPPPQKNLVCRNYFQYLTDWTGQICGSEKCDEISDEDVIFCSMFESSDSPMKYKKEGNTYYFYPFFSLSVGTYAVCTSTTKTGAETCTNAVMPTLDAGEASVTVKILKEECFPLKMYTKIFGPSTEEFGCFNYGGSTSISSLEFTK